MMDHETTGTGLERVVNRHDPDSSHLRRHVLRVEDVESLAARGLDIGAIGEEELSRVAVRFIDHDEIGRVTMIVDRTGMSETCVTTFGG